MGSASNCVAIAENLVAIVDLPNCQVHTIIPCTTASACGPPRSEDLQTLLPLQLHKVLQFSAIDCPDAGEIKLDLDRHCAFITPHRAPDLTSLSLTRSLPEPVGPMSDLARMHYVHELQCEKFVQRKKSEFAQKLVDCERWVDQFPAEMKEKFEREFETDATIPTPETLNTFSGAEYGLGRMIDGFWFEARAQFSLLKYQLPASLVVNQIISAISAGTAAGIVGVPAMSGLSFVLLCGGLLVVSNLTSRVVLSVLKTVDSLLGLPTMPSDEALKSICSGVPYLFPHPTCFITGQTGPQTPPPSVPGGFGDAPIPRHVPGAPGGGGQIQLPTPREGAYYAPGALDELMKMELPPAQPVPQEEGVLARVLRVLKSRESQVLLNAFKQNILPVIAATAIGTTFNHYKEMIYQYGLPKISQLYEQKVKPFMQCSTTDCWSEDKSIAYVRENNPNKEKIIKEAEELESLVLENDMRTVEPDLEPIGFNNAEQTKETLEHMIIGSVNLGHNHGLERIVPGLSWDKLKMVVREVVKYGKDGLKNNWFGVKYAKINGHTLIVKYAVSKKTGNRELSGLFIATINDVGKYIP